MRVSCVLLVAGCWLLGPAFAGEHLGARRCGSCHPAEYAQWRTTPHAAASQGLSAAQRRDPRCAECHATFSRRSAAGEWAGEWAGEGGVQCESCHGAGRDYWRAFVMKDLELARAVGLRSGAEETTCRRCHTGDGPRLSPFAFEDALAKIRHQ